MRTFFAAVLLFSLLGCGGEQPSAAPSEDADLARLFAWMTGHFSSAEQAKDDEGYFDIRLAMVPMWTDRSDGPWMYVEQAVAQALDRPYRQRVYKLRRIDEGLFESRVYAFPDAKKRAGAWKDDAPLADLTPDDLEEKEGCAVLLRLRSDGAFGGGTLGMECANSFGGAVKATSNVAVFADRLEAWDRGYSAKDEPVWGPDKGPYVFQKTEDVAPQASN